MSTTPTRKRLKRATLTSPSSPRPIEEIYDAFPDEWVVVKVTARDGRGEAAEGVILTHSPSRRAITPIVLQAHRNEPGIVTYVFPGGHRAASTEEWRERLDEAARDPLNAFW
jgi:hypothetical protein